MTAALIAFLRARLDDDAAAIEARETWTAFEENEQTGTRRVDVDYSIERVVACTRSWRGVHIARHDPARVLREVEAKRLLIARIFVYEAMRDGEWGCGHDAGAIEAGLCPETVPDEIEALRLLALPDDDHPDFEESWRP